MENDELYDLEDGRPKCTLLQWKVFVASDAFGHLMEFIGAVYNDSMGSLVVEGDDVIVRQLQGRTKAFAEILGLGEHITEDLKLWEQEQEVAEDD